MHTVSRLQTAVADDRPTRLVAIAPATALAVGGLLAVVWSCALGLCAYDIACWLVG
ncbi:MAG TPA: hypothetical protein VFL62_16500 [Bradyrhizobium sp.]|uniref:hypothetical protein n=1 Tax=Bradyrhizobium sp. TaxID=376 RepID=UPI002D80109D|nr:hypothetical protein [Bradyrhizobium sp.]HET7887824.1 hypothetical protein [Bradyrhizobium sp.]